MIGQAQLELAGRGLLVEPVPAPAGELELDAKIERHAVGNHLRQPWRELEVELRVEHQALLYGPQARVEHLYALGAGRRRSERGDQQSEQEGDAAHRARPQGRFWISA